MKSTFKSANENLVSRENYYKLQLFLFENNKQIIHKKSTQASTTCILGLKVFEQYFWSLNNIPQNYLTSWLLTVKIYHQMITSGNIIFETLLRILLFYGKVIFRSWDMQFFIFRPFYFSKLWRHDEYTIRQRTPFWVYLLNSKSFGHETWLTINIAIGNIFTKYFA